jgi:hypothetical protein
MLDERAIAAICTKVRPYSMVPDDALSSTIRLTCAAIDSQFPGDVVECGVWRGGSSFAMLLAQWENYGRIVKPVWMFDNFEGLPPAQPLDGPLAEQWQADTTGPHYYDNCRASLDELREDIRFFGFTPKEAIVVPGWFNETIAKSSPERIALLRVDCDWYDPVSLVLQTLEPRVSENAAIILDDYFAWDGCARAVHEYLSVNSLPYRIRSLPSMNSAWLIKQPNGRTA